MRDLVRDDPSPHRRRSEDQPPVVADPPARRTASPARIGVAQRDREDIDPGARRDFGGLARQAITGSGTQRAFNPPRKPFERPAAAQNVAIEQSAARCRRIPQQQDLAPLEGNRRARDERFGRRCGGKLSIDPGTLLAGPAQRGLGAGSHGTGQLEQIAVGIVAEAQRARSGHPSKGERDRQIGVIIMTVRAGGRHNDIPARRHRLR